MKCPPVGLGLSLQSRSRWSRFVCAVGAVLITATSWAQTNAVSTLAGTPGTPGFSNVSPGTFSFTLPSKLVVDSTGNNLYVADPQNNVIRKIAISGSTITITTYAGSTAGTAGNANGTGTGASFSSPQGLAIDGANNLYVADTGNNAIRKIDTATGLVTTIAGTPAGSASASGYVNDTGTLARFNAPVGIAADRAGTAGAAVNLYVADTQNNAVRQIVLASGVVTTLAGGGPALAGNTNDVGTNARFSGPSGISSDASGTTLYVADRFNNLIRKIAITAGPTATVTTLAGSGSAAYAEGTGTAASFNSPTSVELNAAGTSLLVGDTGNHVIRAIVTASGSTALYAGTPGTLGSNDGVSTAAKFNFPSGIAITPDSSAVYVIDTANRLVRKISAVTTPNVSAPTPSSQSVAAGASATFSVTATSNPPPTYQWQRSSDSGFSWVNLTNGTDVSGATTNQLTLSNLTVALSGTQYRVAVSNGVTATNSTAASLTVTQPPVITSADNTTFVLNQPGSFTITTTGVPANSITTSTRPGFLQLSSTGTNTAVLSGTPTSIDGPGPFVFTINASNSAGTATPQTFTLNVAATTPPALSTVANQQLSSGLTSASFAVTASGTPNNFVYQWQRSTDGGGSWNTLSDAAIDGATYAGTTTATLSITGITPNMNGNLFRVSVTSGGGTRNSNAATLAVAPTITSPSSVAFTNNQSNFFTFTTSGSPTPGLSLTGTLPDGVQFNGSSLLGTPVNAFNGNYPLFLTATNTGGSVSQNFTLIVSEPQAPTFTNQAGTTFNIGQAGSFALSVTGAPTPVIQLVSGSLPSGVVFNSPLLSGTPTSAGTFVLGFSATNGSGTAQQTFTLTVLGVAPTITLHPTNVTASLGDTVKFTGAATGTPTPTLRWQRQPNGTTGFVNLSDDGVFFGTGTTELTIANVSAGMSLDQFRLVASNGTGGEIPSNAAVLTLNLGTVITTIAGQAGVLGISDGSGAVARFSSPSGIAVDFAGNAYIADAGNHTIRKMTASGIVTTIAGVAGFSGNTDGIGAVARFNGPRGIALDASGNVYVADTLNHTVRMISSSGAVTTIAGLAGFSGSADGANATARFSSPTAIGVDLVGTIYVADSGNHVIRRITAGNVITYAGTMGFPGYLDNTVATSARFNTPSGLAVDNGSNVYVADSSNHVIRRIAFGASVGGTVTTIAGTAGLSGTNDGTGAAARFFQPAGVAVDFTGANVYVADTLSSTIRKITAAGEVTTVAGLALSIGSNDGSGATARFNQPFAVAVDFAGNLYVADTRNHTIRRTGPATAPQIQDNPVNRVVPIGQSVSFTARAIGAPAPGYQWQRQPSGSSVFVNLTNDGTFSGVSTNTLTINNATVGMSGDQFRVVVNNGFPTVAISNPASLTVGIAPVFTSGTSASFQAGQAGTFRVTADSTPAATFSSSNLPSWASLNATTGEITGTPPDTVGSPFAVTVTASNGIAVNQTITITVAPAVFPPAITVQPTSVIVDQGQTATFNVSNSGTGPFTYQWRRNGVDLAGANSAALTIPAVQLSNAGTYTVLITNAVGSVLSNAVPLIVNTAPVFNSQPRAQTALVGSTVVFNAEAAGGASISYQWRKNGVAIAGANGSTLTLSGVTAGDAGTYDVQVVNSLGALNSSVAVLTVVTTPTAPVITAQPAARAAMLGSQVSMTVSATGAPAPSYQWRRNGNNIPGATNATLVIGSVQASDAANYDVVINNSVGSVTSNVGGLRVITRSYAGFYFGTFSGGSGNFALYVRDDNTGVFLGYLPSSTAPVMNLDVLVNDSGQFSFNQGAVTVSATGIENTPARAAALAAVNVFGAIGSDGSLSGSLQGGASASLSAVRASDTGGSQNVAGFYQAGATNGSGVSYTIAGPNTQAFVIVRNAATADGGSGTVNNAGQVTVVTNRSVTSEAIVPATRIITGTTTGVVSATFNGATDTVLARQRLVNISSRARVATGDAVAIAGFVISGEESKTVLIRAVGPTLGAAPFNVSGALASPRLELFRGSTSLAVNAGIGTGAGRTNIDAASQLAGAFALGAAGTDAAMVTTLAPGNYTAQVSSSTNTAGVALVEVYDLSAATPGQKLLNIATRASAGTADNTLIAGFVVPPGSSKRVLVRGVGPGLTTFGVTGVLAQPQLQLLSGSTVIAQNTNWNTSADAAALPAASAQVGAFGLANNDSALIVTLAPGNYTAQVLGANNTTGVALIEVYELP